nr:MHC class II regulatory factor RFX1 [Taeniopygia guttata]XP_041567745.1 MHC class II regulatory factor RFX1 [Taeniopygia guttata]
MATQPSYVTEMTAAATSQPQPPSAPPPAGPAPFGAELAGGSAPGAPPPAAPAPPPPSSSWSPWPQRGCDPRRAPRAAPRPPRPPSPGPAPAGSRCSSSPRCSTSSPPPSWRGGMGPTPPPAASARARSPSPRRRSSLRTRGATSRGGEGRPRCSPAPPRPLPPPRRRPLPPPARSPPPAAPPCPCTWRGGRGGRSFWGAPPPPLPPPRGPRRPPGGGGASGTPGGGTFVIQGGYVGGTGAAYAHTTRASPATVQWLLDNYETAEGVSLPRSALYCHYLLHCQGHKLEPVNAASFGKLIRSVFMGLRTRRLGTRGNSKYHYYGLRIKAGSPLLRLVEDQQHLAMRQQPFAQKQRLKPVQKMEGGVTNGVSSAPAAPGVPDISAQVQQYQQFLDASRSLPEFPEIDVQGKGLPEGAGLEDLRAFQQLYREHCEAIVDVMINLQFSLVETLWKSFWRCSGESDAQEEAERRLPRRRLLLLARLEPVLRWVRDCDHALYQGLVEILVPDVLRPIPSALTQAIRNFAKSLESWLGNAMVSMPEELVRVKAAAAGAFAQTLRRYTSLNHLAQAARAVLQNTAQISQMLSDLNRVDFANVQEQAAWVCRCEARVVQRLEQDFKATLGQQHSLEQWAAWLDAVVARVLRPHLGTPGLPRAAKLFLLKWSFYSSMVIRDLTLRSAASFGSFHLIRLLYDEYMYYLVEQRVARARGTCPIAVMGEFANLTSSLNPQDPDKEEDEEEEEEESEEELPAELGLGGGAGPPGARPEPPPEPPLEPPPPKAARADPRGLLVPALPSR